MERIYARLAARPAPFAAAAVALTLLLGAAAARVRPDFSLEQLFPIWDAVRDDYDRYKARFPGEDARAMVLVEAPDLFTPAGVARLDALEGDLRGLPRVARVLGPASVQRAVATPFGPSREPVLPRDASEPELRARAAAAAKDRLLAWNLFSPDGITVAILVGIEKLESSVLWLARGVHARDGNGRARRNGRSDREAGVQD